MLGGGDYAYYNTDKRFGPLNAHIDAWFNQSAPFLTKSVFMPTLGNHEVLLQESYDAWIQRMALPASQTDNFNIYSFDVGHVHFVSILAVRGTQDLPDSQIDWIIQDIQAAQARGQTWIIPYMHVSAFADGASHPSNIALRNQLGPVFEQLGVHLVISSHDQNYERTYPLRNVGQGNPVVTDTRLTGYDANDGTVWLKVSPAGKLSSIDGSFSEFQTNPPPYWTAARDDTRHHFARFIVSSDGSLTTQIYATPGDGTPSFILDSFTYSLGSAENTQTSSVAQSNSGPAVRISHTETLPFLESSLKPAKTTIQNMLTSIVDQQLIPYPSSLCVLDYSMLQHRDKALSEWKPILRDSTLTRVVRVAISRPHHPGALWTNIGDFDLDDSPRESAFESLNLCMPRSSR